MTKRRKIIGGFLPLELPEGVEYHERAVHLNSARYALEYLLRIKNYKKIYLPAFICESVLQPIKRLNLTYVFYRMDPHFMPMLERELENDSCLLYVNYFGVNRAVAEAVSRCFKHVIIDNTQAFFEQPIAGTNTIYSARKFFGVPDGGYLYTDSAKRLKLAPDTSYYRCDGLLKQIDQGHDSALPLFVENEDYLNQCGMKAMAPLTRRLLQSIDYPRMLASRNENFRFLHEVLGKYNTLTIFGKTLNGPLCYPFLVDHGDVLKDVLLKNGVYVNDYWDEVLPRVPKESFEYQLSRNLVPLPIDQNCSQSEMQVIVQIIDRFLKDSV
ncbi:hypothetical protein [Sporolactobacillus spathodeae]|uniref:DegT/DnrJ/EryC1/StrS aminotransferase family protein n=1 Tax=Sporolactobacillus spathodeae TaxID=1465502 RepID=A0ABS2Q643_9BACL|nr:hypothetical protein [Sporolactobacillus spathodeae]MBM7657243.1 hypothetical protein [Sporolactobacillus spathodeae]